MPTVISGVVKTLLEADNKQFKHKIGESQKHLGGLEKSFGSLKIAGVAAFAGISALAVKSIKSYNIQEKAVAKLGAVLKATGNAAGFTSKQLQQQASDLQKITTYGDEAVISMQGVLATFVNIKGDIFKDATKSILDMSAVLGTDLKGSAIQIGKALNSPITGISALSRVGVSFTQVQKDMIRNFVSQNDIASAQKVILSELANEFGGTAEAMTKTFGGQIDQMKNAWGDLKEQIGKTIAISLGFKNGVNGEDSLVAKLTKLIEKLGNFVDRFNSGNLSTGEAAGVSAVGVTGSIVGAGIIGKILSKLFDKIPKNILGGEILKTSLGKDGKDISNKILNSKNFQINGKNFDTSNVLNKIGSQNILETLKNITLLNFVLSTTKAAIKAILTPLKSFAAIIGAGGAGIFAGLAAIGTGIVLLNQEANDKESYFDTFIVALKGTGEMFKNIGSALIDLLKYAADITGFSILLDAVSDAFKPLIDNFKKGISVIWDFDKALFGFLKKISITNRSIGVLNSKESKAAGDWLLNILTGGAVEDIDREMREGSGGFNARERANRKRVSEKVGEEKRSKAYQYIYTDKNNMFSIDFSSGAKNKIPGISTNFSDFMNPKDYIPLPSNEPVPDSFFDRIDMTLKMSNEINSLRDKNINLKERSRDILQTNKEIIKEQRERNLNNLSGAFKKGSVEANRIINQLSSNTPDQQISKNTQEANKILNEIKINTAAIKELQVALP